MATTDGSRRLAVNPWTTTTAARGSAGCRTSAASVRPSSVVSVAVLFVQSSTGKRDRPPRDAMAAERVLEVRRRHYDTRDGQDPRQRGAGDHIGRHRRLKEKPDRAARVRELHQGPEQRDAPEEAPNGGAEEEVVGKRAEILGPTLGERLAGRHGEQEGHRHDDRGERRLEEIDEHAA